MKMCHMVADTLEELHRVAAIIGVAKKHYQGYLRARLPHYDICKSKRAAAIEEGAIEVNSRKIVEIGRRLRIEALIAAAGP
jgi:hypothetical protein